MADGLTLTAARYLKRGLRTGWGRVAPRVYKAPEMVARVTRAKARTVVEQYTGADPNAASAKTAVFVHFDGQGVVHDYVVHNVRALKGAGYRIWFMSNAPRLPSAQVERVLPDVTMLCRRNNFGYDVGAYKDGVLAILDAAEPQQLIVCNDSVYGPLQPLPGILAMADPATADVWGMTDSYELRYHLQSYFLLYHRAAITAPGFRKFWSDLPYVDTRGWLIHHGELRMTQAMLAQGLRARALYPYQDITRRFRQRIAAGKPVNQDETLDELAARDGMVRNFHSNLTMAISTGMPLNPTHMFWDILIRELGFPFIKRDLLQLNPAKIPTIAEWREAIAATSAYDTGMIAGHLLPRLKGRVI